MSLYQRIINQNQYNPDGREESTSDDVSFSEIRELSKRQIESFEHWSRRIIDELLKQKYGYDYLRFILPNGEPLVKKPLLKQIESRKRQEPGRYARDIDAILLDDIEYFFTKDIFYYGLFKPVFESYYSGQKSMNGSKNC